MALALLFAVLSLIDIFVGFLLFVKSFPFFNIVLLYFGLFILSKGIWSIFASFSAKYYLDWMGWIDFLGGIFLLLIYYKIVFDFTSLIAVVVILKGLYSLFMSIQ